MRRRKAPPRAQGAALPRRGAGSSTDRRAAGPTRVLENRYEGLFLLGTSAGGQDPQSLKGGWLGGHGGEAGERCGQHSSPRSWKTRREREEAQLKAPLAPWAKPHGPAAQGPSSKLGSSCCPPAQAFSGCLERDSSALAPPGLPGKALPQLETPGGSLLSERSPGGCFGEGCGPRAAEALGSGGGFGGGQPLPAAHRTPGL